MTENPLIGLSSIIILGISAQWLAWRLRLPAILVLLLFGFVAGPLSGALEPDVLFGDLLLPIVSLSVGVILFEGGLSLKLDDLQQVGVVVRRILSIGALVTWLLSVLAARFVLDLEMGLALLLGAILVVTGPTVIGPMLRQIRPSERVASVLRWEGIIIDPIGAVLAVLVFEVVFATNSSGAFTVAAVNLLKTIGGGGLIGVAAALLLIQFIKRHWLPDYLENPVTLMVVVVAFVVSNAFQDESGLLATTVMGVILANQSTIKVARIVRFKEALGVLLISGLFILLAARLRVEDLETLSLMRSIGFLLALILVIRPLAVLAATLKTKLNWREKLFLAWVAPRGIVAAAVSSVFALELTHVDHAQAETLVPLTFMVIVGTVTIYSLTAPPLARLLKLSRANPQGMLILGAHFWGRALARVLHEEGFRVLLVDTNYDNLSHARLNGLETYYGSILAERTLEELNLRGIGRLLALTSNDEVNSLAALHFAELFGRQEVYQLHPNEQQASSRRENVSKEFAARFLFSSDLTHTELTRRFISGMVVKKTPLTEAFDYQAFQTLHADAAVAFFVIDDAQELTVNTADKPLAPQPGETLISIICGDDDLPEIFEGADTKSEKKPFESPIATDRDA